MRDQDIQGLKRGLIGNRNQSVTRARPEMVKFFTEGKEMPVFSPISLLDEKNYPLSQ